MKTPISKYLFLFVQLILYGMFLILDILGNSITLSNRIKFLVIVLCFLYVSFGKKEGGKQQKFLCYAMTFTVISDIFLLFTDYYLYGLITFIVAQQLYGIRISELNNRESANTEKYPLKTFALRFASQLVVSFILCLLLWRVGIIVNSLLIASIFYAISIVTNLVRSIRLSICYGQSKDIKLFTIGMILFLLCDINVGLFNLSSFMSLGSAYEYIYNISSILMWTFYAPSQLLIALSKDEY